MKAEIWTIQYLNEFNEKYYNSLHSKPCLHLSDDQWQTLSFKEAMIILKDFLDPPSKKLTLNQVKLDFSTQGQLMSIDVAKSILQYYNGRLSIWNKAKKELENFNSLQSKTNRTFKYDIPVEFNSFSIDGETAELIKAYVKITYSLNVEDAL